MRIAVYVALPSWIWASLAAASEPTVQPKTLKTIKIMSFNIYNRPHDRARRLSQIEEIIARQGADLVALQEIPGGIEIDEAPSLAWGRSLNYRTEHFWIDDGVLLGMGLSILSRHPLRDRREHLFSKNRILDSKGVLGVVVETAEGSFAFIDVHLAPVKGGKIKAVQFAELRDLIGRWNPSMPLVVAGDFNEETEVSTFAQFIEQLRAESLFKTLPSKDRRLKTWSGGYGRPCDDAAAELIDDILLVPGGGKRLTFVTGGVVPLTEPFASDHCPIVAEIRWAE